MRSSIPKLLLLGLLVACGTSDEEGSDGPALLLGPAGASTFDDLAVTLVDGKEDKFTFAWTKDGESVEALDGQQTVPATETSKGDVWTVKVSKGNKFTEASLVVGNSAPRAEVSIDPPSPSAADNIVASGYGVDPDGDPTYVEYSWRRNGAASGFKGAVLDAQSTRRGDTWEVWVVAKDGDDDGPPTILAFDIVNGLPFIETVEMNTAEARAPDTLRVTGHVVDPDADPVELHYEWYVDGAKLSGETSRTLAGKFIAGQSVWARVRGDDGRGVGDWATGPVTRITNTPPTGVTATVAPAPPNAELDPHEEMDLLCSIVEEATDVDGDEITYRATWYVDGAPFVKGTTTTVEGDTISQDFTLPGETWECVMIADDGAGGTNMASAEIALGAKSGCVGGASKWAYNLDTMACGTGTKATWIDATSNPTNYCDVGWELADDSIVNSVLNGTSYVDDETYAFTSEDCSGYWVSTRDASRSSNKSCTWRVSHFRNVGSETAEVDGVICVRSLEE